MLYKGGQHKHEILFILYNNEKVIMFALAPFSIPILVWFMTDNGFRPFPVSPLWSTLSDHGSDKADKAFQFQKNPCPTLPKRLCISLYQAQQISSLLKNDN